MNLVDRREVDDLQIKLEKAETEIIDLNNKLQK